MKIENISEAIFIKRPNRFIAHVYLDKKEEIVHVPNTGRCREILTCGTKVILRKGKNENRKTKYDLIAAYKGTKLINIDSHIPNAVVEEALKNKEIIELREYNNILREKVYGNSRFDFKLSDSNKNDYYLEVKGVTFEKDGICMFPDAPTERGRKHILELIDIKNKGMGAGILFLIQLNGPYKFSPYEDMDKKFTEALKLAKKNRVDIFAYNCVVEENFIKLNKEVEVLL